MTAAPRPRDVLPYPPLGMREPIAAAYIGVSTTTFRKMVEDGVMPKPKRYGGLVVWDRRAVDEAFTALDAVNEAATGWEKVVLTP